MININNNIYTDDFRKIEETYAFSKELDGKSILITGATGLVGSCIVDFFMYLNKTYNCNIRVIGLGRNKEGLMKRFRDYLDISSFSMIVGDISDGLNLQEKMDYIIHAASNADPISFSKDPVGTMKANLIGTMNVLEYSKSVTNCKVLFVSTTEIYGKNDFIDDGITENSYGILDCNSLRACYPESKRAAETLCNSYSSQFDINVVIARLCYIYGPTMTNSDSRVSAQFIRKALEKSDIVLKSEGLQKRSYCYVTDAISGILVAMIKGKNCNAYNISNPDSNVTIKQMAEITANEYNLKVIYELPEEIEKKGYSTQGHIIVNSEKLASLGWKANTSINDGIKKTVEIMKSAI